MKTEKTIEEKITEAEEHLPGVEKILKRVSERGGKHYREHPTDVEYLGVGEHKVVAAKWESRYWNEFKGGVGTNEWVALYHFGPEGEIKKISTNEIRTRDQYDSRFDKRDMLYHDYVSLEALADDKVEVAWANKDGKKGPTYTIKLE